MKTDDITLATNSPKEPHWGTSYIRRDVSGVISFIDVIYKHTPELVGDRRPHRIRGAVTRMLEHPSFIVAFSHTTEYDIVN